MPVANPKRKAVRMWAAWHPNDPRPMVVEHCRATLKVSIKHSWVLVGCEIIRVELRPVAPKKRSKKR